MTQEDKELLLKDLCARLPYGVLCKCKTGDKVLQLKDVYIDGAVGNEGQFRLSNCKYGGIYQSIDKIKPYLRSPENLSDEEKDYWHKLQHNLKLGGNIDLMIDFYHSHHIDYRGLIPMGLALEAPEDMYNI